MPVLGGVFELEGGVVFWIPRISQKKLKAEVINRRIKEPHTKTSLLLLSGEEEEVEEEGALLSSPKA
jgi:hypothetical protein